MSSNVIHVILLGLLIKLSDVKASEDDVIWSLQEQNVCFGAVDYQFGQFKVRTAGLLKGLKFVNRSIGCYNAQNCPGNNFTAINLTVVDGKNNHVLPVRADVMTESDYKITSGGIVLLLMNPTPHYVGKQLLRVWHGENTLGESCFDIYAKVLPLPAVSLRLKTTACRTCNESNYVTKCPSSILLNNEELSSQRDGFNIVIIEPNFSDKETFRCDTVDQFEQHISKAKPNSIIAIVLQNMCASTLKSMWYKQLGLNANVSESVSVGSIRYNIAIVVFCKDKCIADVNNRSIPYSYFGYGKEHMVMLTLIDKDEIAVIADDTNMKIIISVVIVILVGCLIGLLCGVRYRHKIKKQIKREKTDDVTLINIRNSNSVTRETAGYLSAERENNEYSTLSEIAAKSVEHIYAYVNPEILNSARNNCQSPFPLSSQQGLLSSGVDHADRAFTEAVPLDTSVAVYMAPSSLPKFDSPRMGLPKVTSEAAESSKGEEINSPNQYEVMTSYQRDDTVNDVTYEEISNATSLRGKATDSKVGKSQSAINGAEGDSTSNLNSNNPGEEKSHPVLNDEAVAYMNVNLHGSDNDHRYVSLNGNVGNAEPVYQSISNMEHVI